MPEIRVERGCHVGQDLVEGWHLKSNARGEVPANERLVAEVHTERLDDVVRGNHIEHQAKPDIEHDPADVEAAPAGDMDAGAHDLAVDVEEDGNADLSAALEAKLNSPSLRGALRRDGCNPSQDYPQEHNLPHPRHEWPHLIGQVAWGQRFLLHRLDSAGGGG